MNEGEMRATEARADDTLERLLERYARVRLEPSPAQAKRARASVMEEAWRRRIASTDAAQPWGPARSVGPAGTRPVDIRAGRRRGPFSGWSTRRAASTLAAAALAGLLVGSTAFAGSRAGGPLYDARLALEELVLPADSASRVDARMAWAQARMAEIVDASSRGDQGALGAALAAYDRTVASLAGTTGDPVDRALDAVASHRAVLVRVAASAPTTAHDGLDRALAASDTAIQRLTEARAARSAPPGAGSGGQGGAGNGNGGQGGGRENPSPNNPDPNGNGGDGGNASTPAAASPGPVRSRGPAPIRTPGRP